MRYLDHDELAAAALQLRSDVRAVDPVELYDRLAAECRTDPARMAQVLMCLAIWISPSLTEAQLSGLADEVADLHAHPAPIVADLPIEVRLRRDVHAATGVLPQNSKHMATLTDDGQWAIRVTASETVAVEFTAVNAATTKRRTLQTASDAHEEYQFARTALGFSHASAMRWLVESYGTSEKQLYRWGFTDVRTGPLAVSA